VSTAITAAKGLALLGVLWLEEPVIPDDIIGTKRVGVEGGILIAGGENLHTLGEFTHAITMGRLDYPQPDASNIGERATCLISTLLLTIVGLPAGERESVS
jgi:L-alanine-DL-glutamate epimerase-like enolase superfamily enzyme